MIRLDYEDPAELGRRGVRGKSKPAVAACIGRGRRAVRGGLQQGRRRRARLPERSSKLAKGRGFPVLVDPPSISDYGKYAGATCLKLNRRETCAATKLACETRGRRGRGGGEAAGRPGLGSGHHHARQGRGVPRGARRGGGGGADAGDARPQRGGRDGGRRHVPGRCSPPPARPGRVGPTPPPSPTSPAASRSNASARSRSRRTRSSPSCWPTPTTPSASVARIDELLPELARHRAAGRRVVFTNGCFDLIHLGHVTYFRFAKSPRVICSSSASTPTPASSASRATSGRSSPSKTASACWRSSRASTTS